MKLTIPRRSARIAQLGAKQGAHSKAGNQAENVFVASGTTSHISRMDASQGAMVEPDAPSSPPVTVSKPCKRTTRKSWTREEYFHVM